MSYRLLEAFARLFEGERYLHRRSTLGDLVAREFFEDLYALGRSQGLTARVESGISVLNRENRRTGVVARRGDGSFGEGIPGVEPVKEEGFDVLRGPIATIEIGLEVKILFKAMLKQIDRVINDLAKQVKHFGSRGGRPISVGIAGVNFADHCISYEGERSFRTDGRRYAHPFQEAPEAARRLLRSAAPAFDEFLLLRFSATNEPPYRFNWIDRQTTELEYGAILTRVSRKYEG